MIADILMGLVAGALSWTLLEYIIHYVLGHLPKGKILISKEHLKHHKDILYFSPAALKIRGAIPVLSLLGAALYFTLGTWLAVGYMISVSAGWLTYEYLHQSIHVNGPKTAYGRWATKYHLAHHFMRPDRNHGVTTPIWDIIFRTYLPIEQVQVRKRDVASVPWLEEAFAQPVPPAFVQGYTIR